jgi:TonB family protein
MSVGADLPLSPTPAPRAPDGLAYRDDLTGLYNRRLLSELLRDGWSALVERHGTVALILLDLDLFKEVNDTWGHMAGDEALRTAAEQLRRHVRESDLLIRYGGDEFVALLPGVGESEAAGLVERARQALADNRFRPSGRAIAVELPIAFSHGVAVAPRDGATGEEVLRRADERLYDEKRRRRELQERSRERFAPWVRVALPALLLVVLGSLLWRGLDAERVPADAPAAAALEEEVAGNAAVAEAPADVEGLLRQIADLQGEVKTLNEALHAERSQDERAQYEEKLTRLGGTITMLQSRLAASAPTPGAPPAPATRSAEPASEPQPSTAEARPAPPSAPPSAVAPSRPPQIRVPVLATPLQLSYPRPARQLRREATVDLLLTVEADGTVSAAEPVGPRVGLGFEEAAQQAALRARFTPGMRDGVAQRMQTKLSVRFELTR